MHRKKTRIRFYPKSSLKTFSDETFMVDSLWNSMYRRISSEISLRNAPDRGISIASAKLSFIKRSTIG